MRRKETPWQRLDASDWSNTNGGDGVGGAGRGGGVGGGVKPQVNKYRPLHHRFN